MRYRGAMAKGKGRRVARRTGKRTKRRRWTTNARALLTWHRSITALRDASKGRARRRGVAMAGDEAPPKRIRRTGSSPPPTTHKDGDDELRQGQLAAAASAPPRMTRIEGVPAMTVRRLCFCPTFACALQPRAPRRRARAPRNALQASAALRAGRYARRSRRGAHSSAHSNWVLTSVLLWVCACRRRWRACSPPRLHGCSTALASSRSRTRPRPRKAASKAWQRPLPVPSRPLRRRPRRAPPRPRCPPR